MSITAIIHEAEEGGYWAEVPSLHGCVTEGETLEEVKAALREAVLVWLETADDIAREKANRDAANNPQRKLRLEPVAI